MLPSLQERDRGEGKDRAGGTGAGQRASQVPGRTRAKRPEEEVRAEGGRPRWGGRGGAGGEDPTQWLRRGGGGMRTAPALPPSRSPCGAWSRPAPTSSASSATAPSLGRRTREPAGPDAGGCERARQQHRRSGRAGGAGPGARHCGNGVGEGGERGVGRTAAGRVGRAGGTV